MEAVIFPLIFLFFLLAALLMLGAPIALTATGYFLFKRRGISPKRAILFSAVPVLMFFAWPLSGLFDLNRQCGLAVLSRSNSGKLGPIDSLLIEGPGMWWLNERIDIERHEYIGEENTGLFSRKTAGASNAKMGRTRIRETDLRSLYKVTIKQPETGRYLKRYVTSASIVIEERATGEIVASFTEPAWGGGLAGNYVATITKWIPFYKGNRFLSCGYTGKAIGVFRGRSKKQDKLYRDADLKLVEEVFTLSTAKDITN